MADALGPFALGPDEGRTLSYGIPHIIKLGELDPSRGCAVFEMRTRAGEEPPLHTHRTEDEAFYVLQGEAVFHCGGQDFPVRQGGFMFLPKGVRHGYTLPPGQEVRLLVITYPVREESGGWGGYIADVEKDGAPEKPHP